MYLKKFGVKDFKAISDSHSFNFKPISVLVGKNSTGKSSLIKSILLLTENFSRSKNLAVMNFSSPNLLLGGYQTVINNFSKDNRISFELPLHLKFIQGQSSLHLAYKMDKNSERGTLQEMMIKDPSGILLCGGYYNIESKSDFIKTIKILSKYKGIEYKKEFGDHYQNENKITTVIYRDLKYFYNFLNKEIEDLRNESKESKNLDDSGFILYTEEQFKELSELERVTIFNSFENEPRKEKISNKELLSFKVDPDLLKFYNASYESAGFFKVKRVDYTTELPKNQTNNYARDSEFLFEKRISMYAEKKSSILDGIKYEFFTDSISEKLTNLFSYECIHIELSPKGKFIVDELYNKNIIDSIEQTINLISDIGYLSPYRGITKRIYFNDGGGISFSALLERFSSERLSKKESEFLNYWLKKFNVGDEIIIERYHGSGTAVFIRKGQKKILLADLGYGYHQVLPILIQIIQTFRENNNLDETFFEFRDNIIIIEEPESNLHPNLQSLLAELFVHAAEEFNIQFILESHSEYLIRKLQYLTVTGRIKPGDVNIHYFDDSKNKDGNQNETFEISILKDGSLSRDFGPGFLDEADNIAIDLFNFKKSRTN